MHSKYRLEFGYKGPGGHGHTWKYIFLSTLN